MLNYHQPKTQNILFSIFHFYTSEEQKKERKYISYDIPIKKNILSKHYYSQRGVDYICLGLNIDGKKLTYNLGANQKINYI